MSDEHKLVHERSGGQLVTRCACGTGHQVKRTTLTDSWPGRNTYHRAECSCGWRFELSVAEATYRALAQHLAASHPAATAAHTERNEP
ncbi:hypothetical protein GCM10027414_00760 [Humibacter ginsengiterrae]